MDNIADIDSRWSRVGGGIAFTGGNVGIGTTIPGSFLDSGGNQINSVLLDIQPGTSKPGGIIVGSPARQGAGSTNRQGYFLRRNDSWTSYPTGMWKGSDLSGTEYWEHMIFNNSGGNPSILFMQNLVEKMRIDANGNVGIGTASPGAALEIKRDSTTGVPVLFNDPNTDGVGRGMVNFYRSGALVGQISTTNGGTNFTSISDRRLKKDFEPVRDALEKVDQIEVRKFRFKTQSENDPKTTGFVAQQLRPIVPYAVTGNEKEKDENGNIQYMSVDYGKLTPLLTAAIQELRKENEALKQENKDIRSRLERLERK